MSESTKRVNVRYWVSAVSGLDAQESDTPPSPENREERGGRGEEEEEEEGGGRGEESIFPPLLGNAE